MTHVADSLREEFPDKADAIHALKVESAHFRHLMEKNETLYREIHRIQSNQEPADDFVLEDLRKQRLHVLDEIGAMIAAHDTKA